MAEDILLDFPIITTDYSEYEKVSADFAKLLENSQSRITSAHANLKKIQTNQMKLQQEQNEKIIEIQLKVKSLEEKLQEEQNMKIDSDKKLVISTEECEKKDKRIAVLLTENENLHVQLQTFLMEKQAALDDCQEKASQLIKVQEFYTKEQKEKAALEHKFACLSEISESQNHQDLIEKEEMIKENVGLKEKLNELQIQLRNLNKNHENSTQEINSLREQAWHFFYEFATKMNIDDNLPYEQSIDQQHDYLLNQLTKILSEKKGLERVTKELEKDRNDILLLNERMDNENQELLVSERHLHEQKIIEMADRQLIMEEELNELRQRNEQLQMNLNDNQDSLTNERHQHQQKIIELEDREMIMEEQLNECRQQKEEMQINLNEMEQMIKNILDNNQDNETTATRTTPEQARAVAVSTCVVCQENPSQFAAIPCGHMCLCQTCAPQYHRDQTHNKACPLCRAEIRSYNIIHL